MQSDMETGVAVYKTPVMARREIAKNPEVVESLLPLERSIFMASIAKTVAEYNPAELASELASALKYIAKDVGYRETDDNERGYLVVRVCEILKRYYGNLSLKDFRMAFEMCITGELDDFLPKGRDGQADRGHYQQFNAEYVCKILNAYKAKRAQVLKKANDAIPEPEPERDKRMEAVYRNMTRKECIDAFRYYKANAALPSMSPILEMLVYQLLSDVGLADEIVVTQSEQWEILQRTINHYASKGMVGDVNRLHKEGPGAPELQHGAFSLARRKALKRVFARMAEEGVEINDYIKFEEWK